jgi:formylglycine-generating enzyme required for sulfatase activity
VLIPAGTFTMGSPTTEEGRDDDETQHEVALTRPYYLGITEVTNAQYRRFKKDHHSGWYFGKSLDGDEQPVVYVSMRDATAFAEWLRVRDGCRPYRLPTEAEWEHACRAGTSTPFWWGATITSEQANYDAREPYSGGATSLYRGVSVNVGSLPPNPWGLHEVHGNAGEFCSDFNCASSTSPETDPGGSAYMRAYAGRSGSWDVPPEGIRAAAVVGVNVRAPIPDFGFRLAVSVAPR